MTQNLRSKSPKAPWTPFVSVGAHFSLWIPPRTPFLHRKSVVTAKNPRPVSPYGKRAQRYNPKRHEIQRIRRRIRRLSRRQAGVVKREIELIYTGIRAAFILAVGHPPTLGIRAQRMWEKSAWWLVKTYLLSGRNFLIGELKELATECRFAPFRQRSYVNRLRRWGAYEFCDVSPEFLIQISYLGRALPIGDEGQTKQAVRKHKEALLKEQQVDIEILAKATAFGRRLAARISFDEAIPTRLPSFTHSACWEGGRGAGGPIAHVQETLLKSLGSDVWVDGRDPMDPDALVDDIVDTVGGLLPFVSSDKGLERQILSELLENVQAMNPIPARVVVVSEPGNKARIVTKSPAELVYALQLIRLFLYRILETCPEVSQVLGGHHEGAIRSLLRNRPDGEVVSADLTSATDLFPRELSLAIWKGIVCEWEVQGSNLDELGQKGFGPMEIHWDDLVATSESGILMGIPTTWPMLCFVNMFWAEWAIESTKSKRRNCPYIICGDDLAAIWWLNVTMAYEEIARKCGAVFSEGKHIRDHTYGLFAEHVFQVERNHPDGLPFGRVVDVRFHPRIPLRGLLGLSHHGPQSRVTLPVWSTVTQTAEQLSRKYPEKAQAISWIIRTCFPGLVTRLRESGIEPHAPRELGGAGIPHSTYAWSDTRLTKSWPRWMRKGIAAAMSPTYSPPTKLSSLWAPGRASHYGKLLDYLETNLDSEAADDDLIVIRKLDPRPSLMQLVLEVLGKYEDFNLYEFFHVWGEDLTLYYEGLPISEFLDRTAGNLQSNFDLISAPDFREFTPRQIGNRIYNCLRNLGESWKSVSPVSKISPLVLLDRMEEAYREARVAPNQEHVRDLLEGVWLSHSAVRLSGTPTDFGDRVDKLCKAAREAGGSSNSLITVTFERRLKLARRVLVDLIEVV